MRTFRTLAAVAALAAIALLVPATAQAVAPDETVQLRRPAARLQLGRLTRRLMTTEASEVRAPRRVPDATSVYVGVVAVVGVCLTAAAIRLDGLALDATFLVLMLLAMLAWWVGSVDVAAGQGPAVVHVIVMLAAMALVGPAGAGIVGMIMGPFETGRAPLRARVFNAGMFATMGVVGGAAYIAAGGVSGGTDPVGTWQIVLPHRHPPARRGRRAVRDQPGAHRRRGSPRRGAVRCAPSWGASSARRARPTSGTASSPSAWSCSGGRRAWGRRASSSSCLHSWSPSGPTVSTRRRSRATSGPCRCWWPPSRRRPPTWPVTAPGSPS